MNHPGQTPDDARSNAENATNSLRDALERHSLDFPELGLHFPAVMAGLEVISLGTVTGDTARQLTEVLLRAPVC